MKRFIIGADIDGALVVAALFSWESGAKQITRYFNVHAPKLRFYFAISSSMCIHQNYILFRYLVFYVHTPKLRFYFAFQKSERTMNCQPILVNHHNPFWTKLRGLTNTNHHFRQSIQQAIHLLAMQYSGKMPAR